MEYNRETFRVFLAEFIKQAGVTVRSIAQVLCCTDATLQRILNGETFPTDELMKKAKTMFHLGFDKYSTLSSAEEERISETIGATGGGLLGFASISAAVGSLGVAGTSAAGISSGLAGLGAIIGGGMLAGVTVAAAIPVVVGAAGYATVKGVKFLLSEYQLNQMEIDPRWEMPPSDGDDPGDGGPKIKEPDDKPPPLDAA